VYLLVFIQNLLVHLGEKILLLQPLTFGGDYPGKGGVPLRAAVRANAERFAADFAPVVADISTAGHLSLRAIAAKLNARGMMTRRSGRWSVENVGNLVGRVQTIWHPLKADF
jgi:hypothetical protein